MPNKFVGAGKLFYRGFSKVFKGPQHAGKVATIGGVKPKISTKKSDQIKRSNRLIKDLDKTMKKDMSPQMKKRGEKLKKEVKDTQKKVYKSKMAMGGVAKKVKRESVMDRLKKKNSEAMKKFKEKHEAVKAMGGYSKGGRAEKLFGGRIKKKKPETEKQKSIKEKILPKKKKDRLNQLRKELGMKKGGSALKPVDKEKNPGLAKLPTQVRNKMGYMKKGGQVRKFGGGKK
jgi:glucan-binding YG repeat protein